MLRRHANSRQRFLIALLVLSGILGVHSQSEGYQENLRATLQPSLIRLHKTARQAGIQVLDLSSGKVLYDYRADETFIPASLVKLFTSYGALKQLGPNHRFSTALWVRDMPQGDMIAGDVWVRSEGDPFFLEDNARQLACRVKELGIRRIRGGIHVDNSYFEPLLERICLDGNCRDSYNPTISATAMDWNTVTFRLRPALKPGAAVQVEWFPPGDYVLMSNLGATTGKKAKSSLKIEPIGMTPEGRERYRITGKLPVGSTSTQEHRFNAEDPNAFVARSFRALLQKAGIDVPSTTGRSDSSPPGAIKLVSTESPTLAEMIHGLNRYSNNFMAEMLLRSLGGQVMGVPGTAAKGISVIERTLREVGIPEQEVRLDSGSGLSRNCRASPRSLCRVLLKVYEDAAIGPQFMATLAVNAQEGTLKNRLPQAPGTVRGKTGTLNDVVAFAGYVSNLKGRLFAVTILLNEVPNLWEAREALDAFLESVARVNEGA